VSPGGETVGGGAGAGVGAGVGAGLVKGFVAPGFERVAETLGAGVTLTLGGRERRADLGEGGGAFCAFVDGDCVVDIWSGVSGAGRDWEEDTRAVIMSSTKGMTTLCAHILEDRGDLDLDAPVVRYWPEFGAADNSATTVRQLLSHQSGAIGVPGADRLLSWDGRGWSDTEAIAAAIAAGAPAWVPGTRHGYHGITFGWLVGELVRRISGQSLGTFFNEEVAGPLGLAGSVSIGTPPTELESVATVMEFPVRPGSQSALRAINPESKSGRSVLAGAHGSLFADELGQPRFADFMNTPDVLASEIGALGATATARALARTYMALADGEDLVSRASVERFRTEQVCGHDAVMGVPTRWAVGYSLEPPALVPGAPPMHGPDDGAFGHMGAGGQIGFADPEARVAVGFVRNHLENQALPLMGACLVDVLYSCTGSGEREGGVDVRG
jgi:CubicO group peptidase (beta-lactamase class C family)